MSNEPFPGAAFMVEHYRDGADKHVLTRSQTKSSGTATAQTGTKITQASAAAGAAPHATNVRRRMPSHGLNMDLTLKPPSDSSQ